MTKPQNPTLQDVAALAGVSTATVSRCLNFPDQVTANTRSKVEQAVATLGYLPNFGARAMAARHTRTIGAIIPTMENAIFARGLQAFQEELRKNGFTLLVASSSYDPDVEEEQIKTLVARGADGLLLIGHNRKDSIYEFLEGRAIPTLVAWAFDPNQSRPSVGFNNQAAMENLAQSVIALGHKQLAMIAAPAAHNDRAFARLNGVKKAMQDAGLDPETLTTIETPYGVENGADAFAALWNAPSRPTAVFCGNDVLAVGALRQAREMGLSVPKDVSITGFDDIELAQVVHPQLATVHVPHQEMGRTAAQILVAALLKGEPLQARELTAQVKLRPSLAALPSA